MFDRTKEAFMALNDEARSKNWEELSIEEKLERLRDVLRSKELALSDLRGQVLVLLQHQHGPHGELLQPMFAHGAGISPTGRRYDPLA